MTTEHQKFENWILAKYKKPHMLRYDVNGDYLDESVALAWYTWKAATGADNTFEKTKTIAAELGISLTKSTWYFVNTLDDVSRFKLEYPTINSDWLTIHSQGENKPCYVIFDKPKSENTLLHEIKEVSQ